MNTHQADGHNRVVQPKFCKSVRRPHRSFCVALPAARPEAEWRAGPRDTRGYLAAGLADAAILYCSMLK